MSEPLGAAFAVLLGHGWARWRGTWRSTARLEGSGAGWRLLCEGREAGRWPTFRSAVEELWPGRRVDGSRPWAVGWSSYEELAGLGGDLPAREPRAERPTGSWLLEPELVPGGPLPTSGGPAPGALLSATLDDGSFRRAVTSIRERIARGDVYQVNLTRRFTVEPWHGGLQPLLDAARRGGSPDYLSWFPGAGQEVLCASMELLLRRRGSVVETRPIKGTRPRGATEEEDRRVVDDLRTDRKEAAELAMVVDLERNDLGRVAVTGSVAVADAGTVHSYAAVHHRVARVTARVPEDVDWWWLLAAAAPGGSVTGCPKHAAMGVITEIEPAARGPYTGALGVVGGNGDLELALPIRSAWRDGDRLEFAAGCGVVWDSDAEAEELESRVKVCRWLELVHP